jgi:hypothetical protein
MTDEERAKLWADFEYVFSRQMPGSDKWFENLSDTRIVFQVMIDLHRRMLEIEKRLNEAGGDGK